MSDIMLPSMFTPASPAEILGAPGQTAALLMAKAAQLKPHPNARLKLLLYGAPGTGKTTIAGMLAKLLGEHDLATEFVNGQSCSVDLVRQWKKTACYRPMIGHWNVKWVDEIDCSSEAAQKELHSYLDRLPGQTAFIATCNSELKALDSAFRTRLQAHRFEAVDRQALVDWLVRYWELPIDRAVSVAQSTAGNVRDALLQAESVLDQLTLKR